MIKNIQFIKEIEMKPTAICFCPLGKDYYTNNFTVTFFPAEFIPDYCEVEKWIEENISGKELIIEDAVDKLKKHLNETYKPYEVIVNSEVNDAAHFPVIVKK